MMEGNLTEFEESVSFDLDDPDFAPASVPRTAAQGVFRGVKFATEIAMNVNKCEYRTFISHCVEGGTSTSGCGRV